VEEMQQEIDAHLTVENHPERGSLIHRWIKRRHQAASSTFVG
jgi:hypothetical protein